MSKKETAEKKEDSPRKRKNSYVKKVRENPWIVSSIVLAILVIIMLVSSFGSTGKVVSESKAAESLIGFLNEQTGGGVEFVSAEDAGLLYMVTVSYNGQNIPVYVTKDGKYYVQGVAELDASLDPVDETSVDVPKADKPVVELFVMSYCPYGTQALLQCLQQFVVRLPTEMFPKFVILNCQQIVISLDLVGLYQLDKQLMVLSVVN
jgi:hypothetical protein